MAIEVEIKLLLKKEQIEPLLQYSLITEHQPSPKQHLKIDNIYYDTPELTLNKQGYALRLRHQNDQWLQTIKGPNQSNDITQKREEYETDIPTDTLHIGRLPTHIQRLLSPIEKNLYPIFETNFSRIMMTLQLDNETQVELAIDQGIIISKNNSTPISEMELELKAGTAETMIRFAKQLQQQFQLIPSRITKAERGYRLFQGAHHETK